MLQDEEEPRKRTVIAAEPAVVPEGAFNVCATFGGKAM